MSYKNVLFSVLAFLLAFQWAGAYAATEQVIYVHTDHLGSPILGRDDTGATVFEYDYKPYGARDVSQGDAGFVGYTGHAQSDDLGLVYARARWMDPSSGRFLSPDPVMFVQGGSDHLNRYAYAGNNPVVYLDPDGRMQKKGPYCVLEGRCFQTLGGGYGGGPYNIGRPGRGFGVLRQDFVASNPGYYLRSLKVSSGRAPGLKNVADRLKYRGDPNSIIRGSDVSRNGGGKRAFVTDSKGRIIKEITPQRVKVRVENRIPEGGVRETFKKTGKPTDTDLLILDKL